MTALRALMAYEQLIRQFQTNLTHAPIELEATLEAGLGFLISHLKLENIGFFVWEPSRNTLVMKYELYEGALMEGEEEIVVMPGSPLELMLKKDQPVVVSPRKPWISYLPLHTENSLMGAIRIVRKTPLPQGRVLLSLPPLHPQTHPSTRTHPLLDDIADILSIRLRQLGREDKVLKKNQYLEAGSAVAKAIFEKPRLHEMLEAVAEGIVHHLGFDRIRFYLIDGGRLELKGIVGLQIPHRLLDLEQEAYPLQPGTNALINATLEEAQNSKPHSVADRVGYVPLVANGQVVGCMAVDNLLSQQVIDQDQFEALKFLAGQIGMAVQNARLFEDIEQQAITDGLTKLYMFRYFQQRLKEELDRADRYSYSIALVMMDVDNFKQLNDQYGHPMGDKVLEYLSYNIRGNIRRIDLAARYGGDEFVLLLPEITEQEAWLMSARLLNALKQTNLKAPNGDSIYLAVTMGIALYPSDARTGKDLIEASDKALYWGKSNSRGDICFYKAIASKLERKIYQS